jgi:His-Xaa-Ser system radical SAM maturase HxsC
MIPLRGKSASAEVASELKRTVWRLAAPNTRPEERVGCAALIESGDEVPEGFDLYVCKPGITLAGSGRSYVELGSDLAYLSPGDILSASTDGRRLHVLWRHLSRQNSILLTERCDHYCLMCSQPPRKVDDDWLLDRAFEVVRLLPEGTDQIGFTGGEPTMYGGRLFDLLRLARDQAPDAGVHVLSNGRRFHDLDFVMGWAEVDNPNMMVGIPIYGAEPTLHDYVVQAHGAFDETVRGILNLGRLNQRVEIRVVIHKQTAPYLIEIAEFIARNLPFVDQVALMGLEMIGLARANMETVWIDPIDYRDELAESVMLLSRRGIKTMVYNHQLCLTDSRVWPYAVKSISDWKNEYHLECGNCDIRDACGGFFFSAKYRMSDYIHAIRTDTRVGEPAVLDHATEPR